MKNNNPIKIVFIAIVSIAIFTIIYLVINYFNEKNQDTIDYIKNYEINEFIPTYISDEDMARIYLNDFVHTMFYETKYAYSLLDDEYKNKKFGSYENFENYVISLEFSCYNLLKYYKKQKKEYTIFGVYDKNNNLFVFKTKGVMQYSVYLDDYTVEI